MLLITILDPCDQGLRPVLMLLSLQRYHHPPSKLHLQNLVSQVSLLHRILRNKPERKPVLPHWTKRIRQKMVFLQNVVPCPQVEAIWIKGNLLVLPNPKVENQRQQKNACLHPLVSLQVVLLHVTLVAHDLQLNVIEAQGLHQHQLHRRR